ncbi:MAG: general stress protein CsbD [Bacteroidetes bacterium]|nr:general stress protein CsbD [Bacteroidota bacterium]MCY4232885.1 general stress protein CsbD [Bacteroidota bacterium]
MATDRMNENWRQVCDQIQSIWSDAEFNEKEMKKARANLRKMVQLIHDKTGEPKDEIFQKISAII